MLPIRGQNVHAQIFNRCGNDRDTVFKRNAHGIDSTPNGVVRTGKHRCVTRFAEHDHDNAVRVYILKGDAQKAKDFIDNLELFSLLANVADVKSLVIHPATTTHSQCTEEELLDQGIKPNTIRLSIGTEHIDDIIQDLDEAFKAVE